MITNKKRLSYSINFASWFTGTCLYNLNHPEYGRHSLTPQQVKYSSGEFKDKLFREIENYYLSGDITEEHINKNK